MRRSSSRALDPHFRLDFDEEVLDAARHCAPDLEVASGEDFLHGLLCNGAVDARVLKYCLLYIVLDAVASSFGSRCPRTSQ